MPRTPYCHPKGPQPATCRVCERYVRDPAYRATIDRVPRAAKAAPARLPLPCVSLGDPTGETRPCPTCTGTVAVPLRGCAKHGVCTEAKLVKLEDGPPVKCCRICPDHRSAAVATARPGWASVPVPPPLDLRPRSREALVTVAAGESGRSLFAITGGHMRRFAEAHGLDLHVLDWPGAGGWGISSKWALWRVLPHYDRILFVDADVLLRPGCVNPLALCPPGLVGMVDEIDLLTATGSWPGFRKQILDFRRDAGFAPRKDLPFYLNTGVMVIPRTASDAFAPPDRPVPAIHCGEQHWIYSRLLDGGFPVHLLPSRCNHQGWWDKTFAHAPTDAILHFSGGTGPRPERLERIRTFAARHPWPTRPAFEPPAPGHTAEVDRRHLLWLHAALSTGRFRRVLEIGSFRGYSARASLAALEAGKVGEVHFCDATVTPELRAAVAASPAADRVTVHECRSADLLARDPRWDLVFVDGDHSAGVVAEETRLLLAGGVRAVFAHDTGLSGRWDNFDGPALLVREFRAAGYLCAADALHRTGEATDRGMFFAAKGADDFAAGMNAAKGLL